MATEILKLKGKEVEKYIPDLAQLRMKVFREWPYLYKGGDIEYEKKYLQVYVQSPKSIVCLLKDGDHIAGATTGLPMVDESEEIRKPFVNSDYDVEKVFYFGESIILPDYRGQGFGKKFFELREQHAQDTMGSQLEFTGFAAVNRPESHPLYRADYYESIHGLWNKFGYSIDPMVIAELSWPDIDEDEASVKTLTFWLKHWG